MDATTILDRARADRVAKRLHQIRFALAYLGCVGLLAAGGSVVSGPGDPLRQLVLLAGLAETAICLTGIAVTYPRF
jgi:hypothetical protein